MSVCRLRLKLLKGNDLDLFATIGRHLVTVTHHRHMLRESIFDQMFAAFLHTTCQVCYGRLIFGVIFLSFQSGVANEWLG